MGSIDRVIIGTLIVVAVLVLAMFVTTKLIDEWESSWISICFIGFVFVMSVEIVTVTLAKGETTPFGILGPKSFDFNPQTTTGMWAVETERTGAGDDLELFDERDAVSSYIRTAVRERCHGRLCSYEDTGESSWIARKLLRTNPRLLNMHFALDWCDDTCSLIFFDEEASEYRSKDPECTIAPDEATRRKIAQGELAPHPAEECLHVERALNAVEEYLSTHQRPKWLDYNYTA